MTSRFARALVVATCVGAFSTVGYAGIIFHTDLPDGSSNAAFFIDGVNVTVATVGGNFQGQFALDTSATGVSGGVINGEIDNQEYMIFTFSQPVFINLLAVSYLYTQGNYEDFADEHAQFVVNGGPAFDLIADTATTALWNGFGTVTNNSPGVEGTGGAWTIAGADIFGQAVTTLILRSGNPGDAIGNADFGFRRLNFVIPAPGAVAVFVVFGMMGSRRRR